MAIIIMKEEKFDPKLSAARDVTASDNRQLSKEHGKYCNIHK